MPVSQSVQVVGKQLFLRPADIWIMGRLEGLFMAVNPLETCGYTFSTYMQKVIGDNRSDEGIDLMESEDLFEIANRCGPEAAANDAIQFVYQQITGIPNVWQSPIDPRPIVPGVLITHFTDGKNFCHSFDAMTPRELLCHGETPEIAKKLPIKWKDDGFHEEALKGVNWRILKNNLDYEEALNLVQQNPNFSHIVSNGIEKGIAGIRDPWLVSTFAYTLMDEWVVSRKIDSDAKKTYGQILSGVALDRLDKIEDKAYRADFLRNYQRTYGSYLNLVQSEDEIAQNWRTKYFNSGWGMAHGIIVTLGTVASVAPAVKFVGALFTAGAAIPLVGALAAAGIVIGIASIAAVFYVSRKKAEEEVERNLQKRVERYFTPRP